MNCSCKDANIELVCVRRDVGTFEALGFAEQADSLGREMARMVHPSAPCNLLAEIQSMGGRGLCFYGYTNQWATPRMPSLFAAIGDESIIVMTHGDLREPITIVREDGSPPAYEKALEWRRRSDG